MRFFLIAFAGLMGLVLLASIALPTGELVALETVDAEGLDHTSTLWIVELPGAGLYLRSADPESDWLRRIATHPLVELEREGARDRYRATSIGDPEVRRAVNEAMARKYGRRDDLVRRFVDMAGSVPVRLEPVEGLGHDGEH